MIARGRRLDAIAGQIGILIVINLVFTFADTGVSLGAHLGGLVAGVLCGLLIVAGEQGRYGRNLSARNRMAIEVAAMTALGVLSSSWRWPRRGRASVLSGWAAGRRSPVRRPSESPGTRSGVTAVRVRDGRRPFPRARLAD